MKERRDKAGQEGKDREKDKEKKKKMPGPATAVIKVKGVVIAESPLYEMVEDEVYVGPPPPRVSRHPHPHNSNPC